jgi:hypothetical protein
MILATELRINDNPEPLGVDNRIPVFSWIPVSACFGSQNKGGMPGMTCEISEVPKSI